MQSFELFGITFQISKMTKYERAKDAHYGAADCLSYQNKTVKVLAIKSNPNAAQDSVSVWFLWSSLQSSVVQGILGIIWLQNYQE